MQDALNQPLLVGNTISASKYEDICKNRKNHQFVLYGDNTLECLTLLNPLVDPSTLLNFKAIVHLPLDQPIYLFELPNNELASVKVCGSYTNWNLPRPVSELINRYDLPDFALFSLDSQQVIFAGELTETASVGNSQWQRELRKIAAAELGIPFIYQTVYSGKDDSQDTIREPTSLLVYNAMLYSIRYKVPSQVLFIEPNIEDSITRLRERPLDTSAISNLLASHIIEKTIGNSDLRKTTEKLIFQKMIEFLSEPKYRSGGSYSAEPRIKADYPCAPKEVTNLVLKEYDNYLDELSLYFRDEHNAPDEFVTRFPWGNVNYSDMKKWTDKKSMDYISKLFNFIDKKKLPEAVAPLSKFSVGIVKTKVLSEYLKEKSSPENEKLLEKIKSFDETLIVPVLLHKKNYGNFQYCKDPYAGNTAAFCELLGFDTKGSKTRGIVSFCVSENPEGFDFHQKYATNLYRSIAKYSDGIIMNSFESISTFKDYKPVYEEHIYSNLLELSASNTTEDSGLTSTYVQLTNNVGGWRVCMIAIHHSSWQQVRIRNTHGELVTAKIGRNEAKVDLVLQDDHFSFLAAEGKRAYSNFFSSAQEKTKIRKAFSNIFKTIDELYGSRKNIKITSLICMLDVPNENSEFFLEQEKRKINESIKLGHISEITDEEFVVIGVYVIKQETRFELFFSSAFDNELKSLIQKNFSLT